MTGVADTSVTLRPTQFRAAADPATCAAIARQIIAGKTQNSRNSLLRAARENGDAGEQDRLQGAIDGQTNPPPERSSPLTGCREFGWRRPSGLRKSKNSRDSRERTPKGVRQPGGARFFLGLAL